MPFRRFGFLVLSLELLLAEALRKYASRHIESEWVKKTALNCYPGNGADTPPTVGEPAAAFQSLASCKALCTVTAQCTAIAMKGSELERGECYLRTNVVESACIADDPYGYDTYLMPSGSDPSPSPGPSPAPGPSPGLYPLDEEVFIRSHRNENLKDDTGSLQLSSNASDWEKWVLKDAGGGKVYIESHRGENLQDDNGDVGLHENAQSWEQWTISSAGDGKVIFTSHHGQYLQDHQGEVRMSGNSGSWEAWTIVVAPTPAPTPAPVPTPAPPPGSSITLKFVSYNLYWWNAFDQNSWKSEGIVNNIRNTLQPDSIGLQECDDPWQINDRAGVSPASPFAGGHGVSVKPGVFNVGRSGSQDIGATGYWGPRHVTWAQLTHIQSGRTFWHFNTHWCVADCDQWKRLTGAKNMLDIIRQQAGSAPVVVTGDFNANMGEPGPQHFFQNGYTLAVNDWVDAVMYTTAHWELQSQGAGDAAGSDHRPVFATLKLQ